MFFELISFLHLFFLFFYCLLSVAVATNFPHGINEVPTYQPIYLGSVFLVYPALEKRCDVNNGNCKQFCQMMGTFGAKCFCATGYKLMSDGVSCEATGLDLNTQLNVNKKVELFLNTTIKTYHLLSSVEFPCGKTGLTVVRPFVRSFYIPGNSNHQNTRSLPNTMSVTSSPTMAASPTEPVLYTDDYDDFGQNQSLSDLPFLESNHSESLSTESRPFKRLVGGRAVAAGEIPWQVLC